MRPSASRLLIGLIGVLILVLGLEWLLPGRTPPASVPLARLHAAARPSALPSRATSVWGEAVLARPVFSISRRPPRVVAGGAAAAAPGQARLAGIMITRSGRRAIFAPEGGGHPLVLAEGASVNQSTISKIAADHVLLAGGAVLRPSYDRNRPALTTAPVFQPPQPPFNPGFPNFPNAGAAGPFGPVNMVAPGQPGFQLPGTPVPGSPRPSADDGDTPPPAFRGTLIPQRRE